MAARFMTCPTCSSQISSNATFCPRCGERDLSQAEHGAGSDTSARARGDKGRSRGDGGGRTSGGGGGAGSGAGSGGAAAARRRPASEAGEMRRRLYGAPQEQEQRRAAPRQRGKGALWIAAGVGVVLLGLYVGGYYALVERQVEEHLQPDGAVRAVVLTRYRYGRAWAPALFTPIHALDRTLRSSYWSGR